MIYQEEQSSIRCVRTRTLRPGDCRRKDRGTFVYNEARESRVVAHIERVQREYHNN